MAQKAWQRCVLTRGTDTKRRRATARDRKLEIWEETSKGCRMLGINEVPDTQHPSQGTRIMLQPAQSTVLRAETSPSTATQLVRKMPT